MPVGIVVATHAEIGAADELQVIGQAGMAHGEVVARHIDVIALQQAVDVRHRRIAGDLLKCVVLHDDEKHVIQARYAARHVAFGGETGTRDGCGRNGRRQGFDEIHRRRAPRQHNDETGSDFRSRDPRR